MPRIPVVLAFAGIALCASAVTAQAQMVTFNKDIAPVIWQNCASCHRPGQLGPFALLAFEDVRPRAREIVRAVKSHTMPPWKPEPGYGEFEGVRRLSDAQIALIERWVSQGSRQGDPADLPAAPAWAAGWQLGQPDLIITMPEPYVLAAGGTDIFRTFVVPIPVNRRRYVRAMEFHPGSFPVVHHANIKIDRTRLSRQWDAGEAGPGYDGGGSREARFPDGQFLGWTPGQSPRVSLAGMTWHIDPDSDLVIEMHLMPGAAVQPVQASVGLFFTDEAPVQTAYMLRIGRQDIDIPAGQQAYLNTDSYTLPVDVEVLGIQPHAHYLAREVRGFATLPDGSTRPLIYIKDWDFHWQDVYRFARPVALPKGSTVTMRYTYDNSSANPRNPNRPPARVTFGQTSTSEMGSLWIQVLPHSTADLAILDRDFSPKILADDIAGDEKWLEMNPSDARLHAELAMCYSEAGRPDDALKQLRIAEQLDPSPLRKYDVGRLLLLMRRFPEAGAAFNQALALKPDMPESLYGLGLAFDGLGRIDEAIDAYSRALSLNLDFADAHFNLARLLATQGRTADAIAHYKQVLRLRPEDAEAAGELKKLETKN
ncbi:MAG: tetratricopeptide repeat protein [Vicinamibacterales bacterium]|nr:tetratricopeptide repeat protein [Vicinamibacterales bacterium]